MNALKSKQLRDIAPVTSSVLISIATTSCVSVFTEVQLHVAFLLSVLPLDPAAGLLHLYAGGVDGDGDGLIAPG